jgi:hypothetical protein
VTRVGVRLLVKNMPVPPGDCNVRLDLAAACLLLIEYTCKKFFREIWWSRKTALILIPVSIVQDSRTSRYQSFAAAATAVIVALGKISEFVAAGYSPRPAWRNISLFVLSTAEYARTPRTNDIGAVDSMGTASWPLLNTMYRGRRLEAQQCRSSGCFPCKSPRMLPMGS